MKCTACGQECFSEQHPEVVFHDENNCICEECSIDYEEVNGVVQYREDLREFFEEGTKCDICGEHGDIEYLTEYKTLDNQLSIHTCQFCEKNEKEYSDDICGYMIIQNGVIYREAGFN